MRKVGGDRSYLRHDRRCLVLDRHIRSVAADLRVSAGADLTESKDHQASQDRFKVSFTQEEES